MSVFASPVLIGFVVIYDRERVTYYLECQNTRDFFDRIFFSEKEVDFANAINYLLNGIAVIELQRETNSQICYNGQGRIKKWPCGDW